MRECQPPESTWDFLESTADPAVNTTVVAALGRKGALFPLHDPPSPRSIMYSDRI